MPSSHLFPLLLLTLTSAALARDASHVNPPFPRIGNCYAAALSWKTWDQGAEYWSKLRLFIGGGYDLHYDWDNPRWQGALARMAQNIARLRQVNPEALVLPYVDVVDGLDDPALPQKWWARNDKGERWSGWPGYWRINTDLREVLEFNLQRVRQEVLGREIFDGVFYDCWNPDPWLVPETAKLRGGQAIVMVNDWNLPSTGFDTLNGCLAEDEINRVMEGKVDFEEFLARYLRWCRESRKPVTTMLVCHPQAINDDPWRWSKLTPDQRVQEMERARREDQQTLRFGLATALMGDGYFGYDAGTMGRGNWWWYPEYDAPLGFPRGDARRCPDGTWQRDFDGGTVAVNGTSYDAVVEFNSPRRDVSTGRVARRFTLPMLDGRIFLPGAEALTPGAEPPPRLIATPPPDVRLVKLDGGVMAAQTPGGLDLRFTPTGALSGVLWRGRPLLTGGWPGVFAPGFIPFQAQPAPDNPQVGAPHPPGSAAESQLVYRGTWEHEGERADYVETVTVGPPSRCRLRFDVVAATDLNLGMWRQYFAFPVFRYAGREARAGGKSVLLPQTLGATDLLPAAKHFTVEGPQATVSIDSSLDLSLIDHRRWGSNEYLLAGYPVGGQVKKGTKWTVELSLAVAPR